jgi:hypothetical protein
MKPEQILEALEGAAKQVGVRVRYEALVASGATGTGGLCKVKGEWWLLIDRKTTPSERVSMLADALATFDTEGLELPAKAKEVIASRRSLKPPGIPGTPPT